MILHKRLDANFRLLAATRMLLKTKTTNNHPDVFNTRLIALTPTLDDLLGRQAAVGGFLDSCDLGTRSTEPMRSRGGIVHVLVIAWMPVVTRTLLDLVHQEAHTYFSACVGSLLYVMGVLIWCHVCTRSRHFGRPDYVKSMAHDFS